MKIISFLGNKHATAVGEIDEPIFYITFCWFVFPYKAYFIYHLYVVGMYYITN